MFASREEAGIMLGEYLMGKESEDTVIVSIPRGGIFVGFPLSRMLHTAFDVVVVKKITSPQNPELAIGAAGEGGEVYWDEELSKDMSEWEKKEAVKTAMQLVMSRKNVIRSVLPEKNVEGKDVMLIDDGIATGQTVLCAKTVVEGKGAGSVSLAVPVIAKDTYKELRKHFENIYALQIPMFFQSVGQFYQQFPQMSDEEMVETLQKM